MKRIKRFEDFEETNEGLRNSLSIIGLLLGLGLGNPETILANKENIENSIDFKEEQVLHLLDSLEKENPSDTIFDKKIPILYLFDAVEKYRYKNTEINLKLDDVIKTMQRPNFPIKIELFFVNIGKTFPIATFEYQHSDKITFMLTKNDVWDKNMLGVKINF